jgi:arylsulfate sulfotransferase
MLEISRKNPRVMCGRISIRKWMLARLIPAFIILFASFLTFACGGGGAGAEKTQLVLSPASAVVLTGQTQPMTLTAGSGGSASVTWSVNNVAGGNSVFGTIDSNGLYTAPAVPPFPNFVVVRAVTSSGTGLAVLTIGNPAPSLASVTPSGATAGSGGTLITVSGAGFTPQSVVGAGGKSLTTTFVSNSELTTSLSAASLATVGVTQITVSTPAPGGGTSAALPFTTLSAGTVAATGNAQVATYAITSPRDANVTIEFGPDTSYGLRTWALPTPTGGGAVSIFVAGMRAFTTYHMRARVDFADGTEFFDADHTYTTGGPDSSRLPNFTITEPPSPGTGPGVYLYSLLTTGTLTPYRLSAVVTDLDGNVIWYYDYSPANAWTFPIKLLPNGHMLIIVGGTSSTSSSIRETDLAGNVVRELTADQLDQKLQAGGFGISATSGQLGGFHHDICPLPNGHTIILIQVAKDFTDLPGYPGVTTVYGDALVDVDQNFNPVWVWNTFDHLDVNRHPMGLPDWTHGNAVVYSTDDGDLVYSSRAQSWLIKIDYEDGKGNGDILWRFGYQGDFTMAQGAPASWQYGQHAPIFLSPNTTGQFRLGVFDNGNDRVLDSSGTICGQTGTPPCYSRPVIFDVDENAKTVLVEWQDIRPEYSFALGSIQELPNNDMTFDLGVFGIIGTQIGSRVVEETKDSPPHVVWQLDAPDGQQLIYRAIRLPSLYPGVQW